MAAAGGSGASMVSLAPTRMPTVTTNLEASPSLAPTRAPTVTANIGATASVAPTRLPTATANVTATPSRSPTQTPTRIPSKVPSYAPSMAPSQALSPSQAPSLPPSITLKPSEGQVAWQETGALDPASNAASGAGRQTFTATTIICMVLSFFCLSWW